LSRHSHLKVTHEDGYDQLMSTEPAGGAVTYTYRPSLAGSPREFTLTGNAIEWRTARQSGSVEFAQVRFVRLTHRPANMQSYRFVTEIWADGAPKLQIVSTSWKSMFEQERLDRPYSAFVAELHRRLAQAGATPQFIRGSNPLIYWAGAAVFAAVVLCLLGLSVRAIQAGAIGGMLFIAAFIAMFGWHGVNFLRRNRPGTYSPDALPDLLLPKP
jgi:hypothetical protein